MQNRDRMWRNVAGIVLLCFIVITVISVLVLYNSNTRKTLNPSMHIKVPENVLYTH